MPTATKSSCPETTKISLPQARQFCAELSKDDPRRPYAQLFIDVLEHHQGAQQMEKECIKKDGFPTWECCIVHIQLRNDNHDLRAREEAADNQRWPGGHGRGDFQTASENWWRELGFDLPFCAKVVDEDLGEYYVFTTISKGLAIAQFDCYRKDDRRHRFVRLYEMFLQYRLEMQELAAGCVGDTNYPETCCERHRQLAQTRHTLEDYARRLQSQEERRPRDTWQDYPVLTQGWWENLVMYWRDGAVVVP